MTYIRINILSFQIRILHLSIASRGCFTRCPVLEKRFLQQQTARVVNDGSWAREDSTADVVALEAQHNRV